MYFLAITGDSKVSMLFNAGVISALRDMGLLQHCTCISGSGTGVLVVAQLMRAFLASVPSLAAVDGQYDLGAFRALGWQRLTEEKAQRFITNFIEPIRKFCSSPTEWQCMKQRLCSPSRYLQPWETEFPILFNNAWEQPLLSSFSMTYEAYCNLARSQEPCFLLNSISGYRRVCHTLAATVPHQEDRRYNIEFRPSDQTPLASIAGACGLPDEFQPIDGIHSSIQVDPLGLDALNTFYMRAFPESRQSELCIAIDTLTGTTQETISLAGYRSILCGAADQRHETLRAYKRQIVTMIDPSFKEEDEEAESRQLVLTVNDLLAAIAKDHTRFATVNPALADDILNWGYALTIYRLDTEQRHRISLLLEEAGDTYGILRALSRSAVPYTPRGRDGGGSGASDL